MLHDFPDLTREDLKGLAAVAGDETAPKGLKFVNLASKRFGAEILPQTAGSFSFWIKVATPRIDITRFKL
jgi:hypothetical protein